MKREVKIGIFAVAMIGVAWAGIRFLKGFDIFSRNVEYYAAYDQINGVQNASPIMMKGVKIGSVTRLSFDPALRHMRHDPDLPPADLSGAYRGVPDSLYNITLVHIPHNIFINTQHTSLFQTGTKTHLVNAFLSFQIIETE